MEEMRVHFYFKPSLDFISQYSDNVIYMTNVIDAPSLPNFVVYFTANLPIMKNLPIF